ncbi:MAG: GGDEF domain-containing protein [Gammaproteobacteria bacterium HGW-Gammaproteobacteria-14]|nr:MAG: GGDEF domain-containing protein [Gammaproteobacteria bacterium HGW-Gammaproteobacteria-14]
MRFSDRLATDNALALVRSSARLVFAVLTFLYLRQYQEGISGTTVVALVVLLGYLAAQGALLWRGGMLAEFGGMSLDIVAIALAVWLDPSSMPPTLLLFLVLVLSGGLLHGPKRFNLLLALTAIALTVILSISEQKLSLDIPAVWFALTIMTACAVYAGVLLQRNHAHARLAREAAWQDPQTGFISHQALLSTASWLLPLHDRMASPLTLALLSPGANVNLPTLAEHLSRRLRRSDVAARFDGETLALMLPCTTVTAAENLLTDLHQQGNDFRAAIIGVQDSDSSLDANLRHLEHHLQRAGESSGHWLVHAPTLSN